MVASWKWLSFRIGTFGFLKEYRPEDPYITQYLVGPVMNLTEEQVNQEVYPVATYLSLFESIFVFLLTDFLCYKPIIVLNALSGVISQGILMWGRGLRAMQVMEVFYATMSCCEIAYYTYIYAKVDKEHYQKVTSHMRAAALAGRFTSAVSSQLLISLEILSIAQLNHLTFAGMTCALICAVSLPSMKHSMYFHKNTDTEQDTISSVDNADTHHTKTNKTYDVMRNIWSDMKEAYLNLYVLQWCILVALATCGYNQMMTYTQLLWTQIQKPGTVTSNAAVEAIYTITSAVCVIWIGLVKANWVKYGEIWVGIITILQGLVLIHSASTDSIIHAYAAYVIFGTLYHVMLTIAYSEIAKHLKSDSKALVFGVNTFVALLLQTILTFTIAGKGGLALSITHQFFVYGGYFIAIGVILFFKKLVSCITYSRKESLEQNDEPESSRSMNHNE